MTVRLAILDEVPALADLAAATFPLACPPHLGDEAIVAFVEESLSAPRLSAYLRDPQRVVLVDEADGVLRGYAMVVFGEPADQDVAAAVIGRPTAELNKCYVAAGHHGTGIAATLIATCLAAARDRGAHSMWLGTNQGNTRAITFYTKHGFTIVGRRRFVIGGRPENDVVMECPLTNPHCIIGPGGIGRQRDHSESIAWRD